MQIPSHIKSLFLCDMAPEHNIAGYMERAEEEPAIWRVYKGAPTGRHLVPNEGGSYHYDTNGALETLLSLARNDAEVALIGDNAIQK